LLGTHRQRRGANLDDAIETNQANSPGQIEDMPSADDAQVDRSPVPRLIQARPVMIPHRKRVAAVTDARGGATGRSRRSTRHQHAHSLGGAYCRQIDAVLDQRNGQPDSVIE
jgi:hypothetical protein